MLIVSSGLGEVRIGRRICELSDQETTEARQGSLAGAQSVSDQSRYGWEEKIEKCDGCEEIAGRLGEKGDGDKERIQRSDENSDENSWGLCMCPVFGI